MSDPSPTERTRLLSSIEQQEEQGPKEHHATWAALKPFVRPLLAANFISIVCGLNDGSIGVIIPRLKEYYGIPNETVSLLFLCNSMGYFVSAAANGYMVHRLGQLGAIYLGGSILVVAYSLLIGGLPFKVMACIFVLQGCGIALLDAGMNVYTSNVPMATLMLNILHALYGIGAMLSPVVGTILLVYNISWRGVYVVLAVVAVSNIIVSFVGFRNVEMDGKSDDDDARPEQEEAAKSLLRRALFHPMTVLGALYILVYVGTEVTVGGWGYTYLTEGRHGDSIDMGKVVAGYWASLAAGRIILGYLTEKFGEKPMVALFTAIAAVGLVIMWITPNIIADSIILVATGFLLGPMFPSTISLASKVLPREMHAASIGFIAGLGAGGAALFPFVTGQVSGKYGILAMPAVCLFMTITMLILWIFVPSKRSPDHDS